MPPWNLPAKPSKPVRVLLDECLPHDLVPELVGHEVLTVSGVGWSGVKNGELLRRAAQSFSVFITVDKRLHKQQRIPPDLAVITLIAYSNRIQSLRPLVPSILKTLKVITPGEVVRVSA